MWENKTDKIYEENIFYIDYPEKSLSLIIILLYVHVTICFTKNQSITTPYIKKCTQSKITAYNVTNDYSIKIGCL